MYALNTVSYWIYFRSYFALEIFVLQDSESSLLADGRLMRWGGREETIAKGVRGTLPYSFPCVLLILTFARNTPLENHSCFMDCKRPVTCLVRHVPVSSACSRSCCVVYVNTKMLTFGEFTVKACARFLSAFKDEL